MNNNSTNVLKTNRTPLSKSQVARILGLNRSELLMKYGYITTEVLQAGKWTDIKEYKRRHLLLIPVVEAILKQDGITWEEAHEKLKQ